MIKQNIIFSENGAVLVTALLILLLLAFLGKAAVTGSKMEREIAANHESYKKTFYTAQAGLAHAKAQLQAAFTDRNQARIASGQSPDWDFALNGSIIAVNPATSTDCAGGAVWIKGHPLEDGTGSPQTYTVTVWNNPEDPGGAEDDTDCIIFVRSLALGGKRTKSSIEALLRGQNSGHAVTGYFAQPGNGTGKNNNTRDIHGITNFTRQ